MSPLKPGSVEEIEAMAMLAKDVEKVVAHIAPGYGLDPLTSAFALGVAANHLIRFAYKGNDEACLAAAATFGKAAQQSMADMISGSDSVSGSVN